MNDATAVEILPATRDDVPLVLELIGELADYERLRHEVVATAPLLERALFGPTPSAAALIARVDGAAAGFALYFHNFSTFLARPGLYLEDLYVRPEYRGRGIGRALLSALAAVAVARDCGRLEWAVLDWNRPARDFYESLGAAPKSSWITYQLTGDALRRLAEAGPEPP